MTTTQVPSPDTPGVAMYPHEVHSGDFVLCGGRYFAFRNRIGSDLILAGITFVLREHDMVEVVR